MRRISSKSKAIRYQQSSQTCFSSPTWLMQCTRYLSPGTPINVMYAQVWGQTRATKHTKSPPVVPKTFPSTSGHKVPSISSQPEDGGPKPEVSKLKESTPSTPKPSQQVQEQVTEASSTNLDKANEPTPEKEQPP